MTETMTLWRPVGPEELELVRASGWKAWPPRQAGGRDILELWVPAEELDEFNRHIVGLIEVVHEFRPVTGQAR